MTQAEVQTHNAKSFKNTLFIQRTAVDNTRDIRQCVDRRATKHKQNIISIIKI